MKTTRKKLKKRLRISQLEAKSHLNSALTLKWQAANAAEHNARLAREVREGEEMIANLRNEVHKLHAELFVAKKRDITLAEVLDNLEEQS